MQKDPLTAFLAGALCLAALGVFVLTLTCEWRFRQLSKMQPALFNVQVTEATMTQLANDTMEYGRRNPAVNAILQDVSLLPKTGAKGAK